MIYNLKNFDPSIIMGKIQNKMPFYNEYHFQFEFAIALKEFIDEKNIENIEIVFEAYYPTSKATDKESNKRNYTDIVIYDKNNGDYIALELKYNLRDRDRNKSSRYYYNNGKYDVSVAKKGATDNCRYDFLYDIYRLEQLRAGGKYENTNIKSFVKGYSIIISNDEVMWNLSSPHPKNQSNTLLKISKNNDRNFCIGDRSLTMQNCFWTGGKNYKNLSAIRKDFSLKKSYECNWNKEFYFEDKKLTNKSPSFRYLIIEVEKQ